MCRRWDSNPHEVTRTVSSLLRPGLFYYVRESGINRAKRGRRERLLSYSVRFCSIATAAAMKARLDRLGRIRIVRMIASTEIERGGCGPFRQE
jgi:hypothetical protein